MKLVACRECGLLNTERNTACSRCGAPLGVTVPAPRPTVEPSEAASPIRQALPESPTPGPPRAAAKSARSSEVKRTGTGLGLLALAALLSWIPACGIGLAGLFALTGMILMFLGRRPFGTEHARQVTFAVVLVIAAIGAVVGVGLTVGLTMASGGALDIRSTVMAIVVVSMVATALVGFAWVLFALGLSKTAGKAVLWTAYGASLSIGIASAFITGDAITVALSQPETSRTIVFVASSQQISGLYYLAVIPSALWVLAYYMASSRISAGEIPRGMSARVPGTDAQS